MKGDFAQLGLQSEIYFDQSLLLCISDSLRALIKAAPGNKLIACDFSSIEARVLAWLAGEEKVLDIFRGHGKIYEHAASSIFGVPIEDVTKYQRLIGKVAVLALGYQGGVGAFQSMAKVYLVKVPDEEAEVIKKRWRETHPNIVAYWSAVEAAAIDAVYNPGQKFFAGAPGREICYLKKGSFLFCRLPSGRALCYPYAKITQVKTPWGEMRDAVSYKADEHGKFKSFDAYGGLFVENATQAAARDLLAEALHRLEARGYPAILTVHDEIVTEVKKDFGSAAEMEKIMCELPSWAKGLPVSAEAWEGERYRK